MNPAPERQTIIRIPLLTALLDSVKTTKRIEIKQIDFAPSQATGLHNHPCPVVGYIARGSVNFQVEGEPPKTLRFRYHKNVYSPGDITILDGFGVN